jgi:hypothetical protein
MSGMSMVDADPPVGLGGPVRRLAGVSPKRHRALKRFLTLLLEK